MSYQVIARKWRPQSFDEVSGQSHVTTALRNAIRSERIPHAMLLTGPRGVGKTTLARLIARCLNCEKGPTDTPCGTCDACVEITEGRSIDVQEIDAASRTGVDDMREVIESIRYAAAPGKHRIYVIDEVHMLSTAAFNALLKTLEEPPPRSLFVFATTNPEKIPFTVLSRCQRHDLRRIALTSVSERLAEICAAENIEVSASALSSIAREGDGSMRDAQTLLDQIVAYAGTASADGGVTQIDDATVAEVLDLVDRRVVRGIIETCLEGNARAALEYVVQATSGGSEPRRVADALLEVLRDLTVLRIAPEGENLFEGPDEERAELIALAQKAEPARLRRMFRALVREIEDLSWAPQPAAVLEMAVIRLATMPAGDDVAGLLARLDQLERRLAAGGGVGGGSAGGAAPNRGPANQSSAAGAGAGRTSTPRSKASAQTAQTTNDGHASHTQSAGTRGGSGQRAGGPASPTRTDNVASASESRTATEHPNGAPQAAEPATDAAANASMLGGGAPPQVVFDRFRTKALDLDRAKFISLDSAKLVEMNGSTITLAVPGAFHADRIRARISELESLANQFFDRPTDQPVRILVELLDAKTEREVSHEARETSRRQRQEALNSEPVNIALEVLEAEIVEIRPLGENR